MNGECREVVENPTSVLSDYFARLALEDVPADVIAEAKRFILDLIACVAAAANTEIGPLSIELAGMLGLGEQASVAGSDRRFTVAAAAYANGRMGNCMDFEEAYPSGVHFGCGAFAAALAIAEARKLSGREFLLAAIAGYELGGRVSEASGTYLRVENGRVVGLPDVWGISTCVVFAAAGAAAKALRFDAPAMAQAFGVAGSNTPVPIGAKWAVEVKLPNTKYCDTGWCTLAGVFGALSAEAGSTAVPTLMDGERGLFRMAGIEKADTYALAGRLGERWLLRDIMYKPWPCCRWMHYPLTALEELLERHRFEPEDIQEIVVETNPCAMSERFLNPDPDNFVSKQFSYPHAVVMRILNVPSGAQWLSEDIGRDPLVRRLRNCVKVTEHERASAFLREMEETQDRVVRHMPSAVSIRTSNGSFRAESDHAWGDPWHEHTRWGDEEMARKVASLMPRADVSDLLHRIATLESQSDVDFIARALRTAVSGRTRRQTAA
ncbi:MAG: hypothetical protein BGN87_19855 [Rhizobiales bacterium 65-79]|jgi:2-methylcitrate dehydratase PrpD|nr:MmgE/PrpD family protein [Hyphomicrobiales bacterium]OJU04274.1 MAG: hypothetical protein BGN87_19855 [Rhizobiales bacterium 65-79]